MKRSKKEITLAIQTFKNELSVTKELNFFGEDNHLQINKAIEILSSDDIESSMKTSLNRYYRSTNLLYVCSFLETIIYWLEGEEELIDIIWNESSLATEISKKKNIIVCKKMCGSCPFSKNSLKGFLANYELKNFTDMMSNDFSLPCHNTVKKDTTLEVIQQQIDNGEIHHCRGYVESYIKSCRIPRNNESLKRAIEQVKSEGLSDESMSDIEFRKHHEHAK